MSLRQIVDAFVFVSTRSARNRFLQKLGRLKQPRYAFSAFVGVLYFATVFGRNLLRHGTRPGIRGLPAGGSDAFLCGASMAVFLLMLAVWALPDSSGGITFAPAEIQFLFPAPLRRWQLLLYKVLRSQPQILFTSAIMTLLGFRQGHFLGVWATFTVLNLYLMMASLGRARLQLAGVGWLTRMAFVLMLIGATIAVIAVQYPAGIIQASLALMRANHGPGLAELIAPFHRLPLSAIFFVPRLVITASLPGGLSQLLVSCLVVLFFGALFFLTAAGLDVSFEEASIVASQKRVDSVKARGNRRGGSAVVFRRAPVPFRLRPTGNPELAIFWKNLIAVGRVSGRTLMIIILVGFAVVGSLAATAQSQRSIEVLKVAGTVMLSFGAFFAIFAPFIMKADLRLDQRRFDFLKSLPLAGERLVAAELGAPDACGPSTPGPPPLDIARTIASTPIAAAPTTAAMARVWFPAMPPVVRAGSPVPLGA